VLLAYIRRQNLDLGSEIDKYNAQAIMLRNVSLGLVWIAGIEIVAAIDQQNAWHLLGAVFLILVSLLVIKRQLHFDSGFIRPFFKPSSLTGSILKRVSGKRRPQKQNKK
jgi:hypothetical protein